MHGYDVINLWIVVLGSPCLARARRFWANYVPFRKATKTPNFYAKTRKTLYF
jgi:hypothetical protein